MNRKEYTMTKESEIVRALREMLPPKVDYAELVASPVPSSYGVCYVWEDPEPYQIEAAIALIESLTAENARLKIRDKTAKYHVYKDKWADAQIKLAASQRRERAAVEDLNLTANCDVCKHYDADEISCAKPTVDSYSCFEWRGVKEERE